MFEPHITFNEPKYVIDPNIAEFFNAWSSFSYFIAALFIKNNKIATSCVILAISSFMFHAHPNLSTEMMDEISILIVVSNLIGKKGELDFCLFFYLISCIFSVHYGGGIIYFHLFSIILSVQIYRFISIVIDENRINRNFSCSLILFISAFFFWLLEQFTVTFFTCHVSWHIISAGAIYYASKV